MTKPPDKFEITLTKEQAQLDTAAGRFPLAAAVERALGLPREIMTRKRGSRAKPQRNFSVSVWTAADPENVKVQARFKAGQADYVLTQRAATAWNKMPGMVSELTAPVKLQFSIAGINTDLIAV